jgi:dihydroorotate dehydrogenase (fumarate)
MPSRSRRFADVSEEIGEIGDRAVRVFRQGREIFRGPDGYQKYVRWPIAVFALDGPSNYPGIIRDGSTLALRVIRNNLMPDLSTTYLGLQLANPFMVGASPLADRLDSIKRLEDAGCAAIVLHSLFEEQVTQSASGRIREMDPLDAKFAGIVSYFPESNAYSMSPDAYLEHLHRAKSAVQIPIIGSINGTTPAEWLSVALRMEQAGADAIELNTYQVATDADQSASSLENDLRQMVLDLKHELKIPLAVKLSPFYTAFAHVARQLEHAGADGLVIFNRFLQPDIDVRHMAVWPRLELSDSSELLLRLRWLAILHGHVRCSLAVTGGVATPIDGIKAILAGAHVVQMVSAIMRHGPAHFRSMREELAHWMEGANFARLDDVRGRLSLLTSEDPAAFERAQYIHTVSNWSSWLGYQAHLKAHKDDALRS